MLTKGGLQQKGLFLSRRGSPARAVPSGAQAPLTVLPPALGRISCGKEEVKSTTAGRVPFKGLSKELSRRQPLTSRWPHWVAAPAAWSPPACVSLTSLSVVTAARGSSSVPCHTACE